MSQYRTYFHDKIIISDIELGEKLNEGKTKIVYALPNQPCVLLQAKDMITAGGGAKSHDLKGKSALANTTTVEIFKLLNNAGNHTCLYFKNSF